MKRIDIRSTLYLGFFISIIAFILYQLRRAQVKLDEHTDYIDNTLQFYSPNNQVIITNTHSEFDDIGTAIAAAFNTLTLLGLLFRLQAQQQNHPTLIVQNTARNIIGATTLYVGSQLLPVSAEIIEDQFLKKETLPNNLSEAVENENIEFILASVANIPSLSIANKAKLLHLAIEHQENDLVQKALDAGISANLRDNSDRPWKNQTPLEHALILQNETIIRLLKDKAANLNYVNEQGWSYIHTVAATTNRREIISLFVYEGCDCFKINEKTGENLYHLAAKAGHHEAINIFHGVDKAANENINLRTKNELKTPLIIALDHARPDTAINLFHKGASLDINDKLGTHPLAIAAHSGYHDFIKTAFPKASPEKQFSTLVALMYQNKNTLVIELIKSLNSAENISPVPANVSSHTLPISVVDAKTGFNVYHLAAQAGENKIIDAFYSVDNNSVENINARTNEKQQTPLHLALEGKRSSTAINLLQKGASLDMTDSEGKHPLALAISHECDDFIKTALPKASLEKQYSILIELMRQKKSSFVIELLNILVPEGSSDNIILNQNYDGKTLLINAIDLNDLAVFNDLLTKSVNINVMDTLPGSNRCAIMWAAQKGAVPMVDSLLIYNKLDLILKDFTGNTITHYFVRYMPNSLSKAIEKGAPIDIPNSNNYLPLHDALFFHPENSQVSLTLIQAASNDSTITHMSNNRGLPPLVMMIIGLKVDLLKESFTRFPTLRLWKNAQGYTAENIIDFYIENCKPGHSQSLIDVPSVLIDHPEEEMSVSNSTESMTGANDSIVSTNQVLTSNERQLVLASYESKNRIKKTNTTDPLICQTFRHMKDIVQGKEIDNSLVTVIVTIRETKEAIKHRIDMLDDLLEQPPGTTLDWLKTAYEAAAYHSILTSIGSVISGISLCIMGYYGKIKLTNNLSNMYEWGKNRWGASNQNDAPIFQRLKNIKTHDDINDFLNFLNERKNDQTIFPGMRNKYHNNLAHVVFNTFQNEGHLMQPLLRGLLKYGVNFEEREHHTSTKGLFFNSSKPKTVWEKLEMKVPSLHDELRKLENELKQPLNLNLQNNVPATITAPRGI